VENTGPMNRLMAKGMEWSRYGEDGVLSCLDDYQIPDDRLVPDTTSEPDYGRFQSLCLIQLHSYNKLDSMLLGGIYTSKQRLRKEPLSPEQMLTLCLHTFNSNLQYDIVHPIHIPHIFLPVP